MASTAAAASLPSYMLPGVTVTQPPHLDGDPTLATEILPGPPSITSVQQAALKGAVKKPVSYLPPKDPNSTYSALLAITPQASLPQIDGPRTKRMRTDRLGASGRAQRASARHQNGQNAVISAPPIAPVTNDSASISTQRSAPIDVDAAPIEDDTPPGLISAPQLQAPSDKPAGSSNGRGRPRRDKGKGKEAEGTGVKVKEEPKAVVLHSPEPSIPTIYHNEDHCSACRSIGALVYCDGCPRAFHFWCLDPPSEGMDENESSKWFCQACKAKQNPPKKPSHSFFSPLINHLNHSNPVEFQLPEDIRTFFKDVATAPNGAYVDNSETKQPRLNRLGQLDERDSFRLRDRNGAPVLCFRCGTSALPESMAAAAPATKRARRSSSAAISDAWRPVISCDYCPLHWHLDCIDPPLPIMPPFNKKWLCPNHAEQVIPLKRRIPKQHAPPMDVTAPGQFNNGNIEVIPSDTLATIPPKVAVDEVLINGRRYRVPERVIILDFWNRINGVHAGPACPAEEDSGLSSPLTSLSSLEDDMDDTLPQPNGEVSHTSEDLQVAKMLVGFHGMTPFRLHRSPSKAGALPNGILRHPSKFAVETAVQTDGDPYVKAQPRPPSHAEQVSGPRRISGPLPNGIARTLTNESTSSRAGPSTSTTIRRRKSTTSVQPEPSTRELRSRAKREDTVSSVNTTTKGSSVLRSEAAPRKSGAGKNMTATEFLIQSGVVPPREMKPPDIIPPPRVKLEDIDPSLLLSTASSISPPKPKRTRTRRPSQKDPEPPKEAKEKRGRKRKVRDDDNEASTTPTQPSTSKGVTEKASAVKTPATASTKTKTTRAPRRGAQSTPNGPVTPRVQATAPASTSTPTLKIRLPRLSNVNLSLNTSPQRSGLNVDTPTCL